MSTPADTPAQAAVAREAGLRRELSSAQVTMIAIGGAIGTGLFLGSTLSIRIAGGWVVASYLLGAVVAFLMTRALGELAGRHPTAGSFGVHAEIYQGSWAGFSVRWTYWLCQVIAIGGEVVAAGIYARFWFPQLPLWVPVVAFSLLLVAVNALSVGAFGTFEYWFAMIKVVAILLFILFAAALLLGLHPAGPVPGPGAGPLGRSYGPADAWLALPVVMFSYLGTEIVAVTAGEAKDPGRAIPRALRATVLRLILFYVLSIALLLAVLPAQAVDSHRSPFVRVFETVGIPAAAGLMNFVVLTAALSSINTNLYLTSRMLFSLARAGHAPPAFGRLDARGAPLRALLASTAGMALAAAVAKLAPGEAFVFLFGVSIFGGLFVWTEIFLTHLAFLRRPAPGAGRAKMAGSATGLALMLAILVTTWWTPGLRVTLQSGLPWVLLLTVAWAIRRRRAGKPDAPGLAAAQ
jgi:amino acid transporter, AAT family